MANFFDQFDSAPAPAPSPSVAGNFFDQFDTPAPVAAGPGGISGADPGALQIRVGAGRAPEAPASFADRVAGDHSAPQRFASQTGTDTALGAGLRAKADEMLIGKPSAENSAIAGLLSAGQAASLNAAGNVGAAVATGLGNLDKIGLPNVPGYGEGKRSFAENYRAFQDMIGAYTRQNPYSAGAGTVAGAVAAAPLLPGLAGAPAASLGGRALQYGVTGGLYGGAAEALDSKDPLKALQAGGVGLALGAPLGVAAEKAAPYVVRGAEKVRGMFGGGAPAEAVADGFTPQARGLLQEMGLDATTLPDPLAQSLRATFAAKGVSPAAVREAQAAEFGIPLSRAQATGDPMALSAELRAASGSVGQRAQTAATDFAGRQGEATGLAREFLARVLARDHALVANPQAAGEAVADAARRIGDDYAFRGAAAQRQADQALEAVRGRFAPADTLDAASLASQGVRDAAAQSRAAYKRGYDEVAQIPGVFAPGALDRMGSRVRDRLGAEVPIDGVLTPAATRAINDLDALPGIFGLQPGEGPNLQQVDQIRKRLVAYRGTTGVNATDRRAVDRVLSEFDGHVEDAMGAGLFGPRQAAGPRDLAQDGFPGVAATPAASGPLPAAGGRPDAKPETLVQYLARNGGIALDGDARAADLGRIMTPFGPLGRRGGRPIEEFRDQLASEGFIRPDSPDGMISRRIGDEVHDLIGIERGGDPVYRLADLSRGGAPRDVGGRIADQSAAYAERLAPFRQQVADDLAEVGYRPRDIDPAHLDDAAARLFRREHDTGADAYEAAIMGRDATRGVQPAPYGTGSVEAPPLDGASAAAGAFPGGDTAASDAMRRARGLFREHQQAFRPRDPGDAAGRNLQRIVEADATPNEVASMLFGGASGRVTGRQLETLDRLRAVVGEDSPAWGAVRQAVMGRYLDGRDAGRSLDYLLRGEGRELASRVLTGEQRAGLDAFRTGMQQAEAARAAVPGWVQDIARTGYDGNRVLADLFGSGIPGARPGSAAYGRGLRQYLGADSPEWSGLRQAAWMRLTGDGKPLQPRVEAERIRAFTGGEGKGLASAMFSPDELSTMNRYATAVAATDIPKGGRLPDGGRAKALAGHVLGMLASGVAAHVGGPVVGAVAGYASRMGQQAAQGGLAGLRAERAFNGGAPRVAPPLPGYATDAGRAGGRLGGLIGAGVR